MDWKSFPLVAETRPGRRFGTHAEESWQEAEVMGEGNLFRAWDADQDMPSSSWPALEAAKCAEFQGRVPFGNYHLALLRAFFEEQRDISNRVVLLELAREVNLDVERFRRALDLGRGKRKALAEFKDAQLKKITGIPTAHFSDGSGTIEVVGAVPLSQYTRLVDWLLAS